MTTDSFTIHDGASHIVVDQKRYGRKEWAAEYLGVSERYLRELVYRGILPCSRLGTALIFDREDLDALVAANRVEATVAEVSA